jgi:fumarate reductase flavoprotein subunit
MPTSSPTGLTADLTADLVIIGAGGAGLTAAASALDAAGGSVDIIVLEKAPTCGGNTSQSAGMFAIGSPAQRRKGIIVSREEVFREKMAYANWRVDPGLTLDCIDLSGKIVAWLEDKGMRFDNVIEFLREGQAPQVFHSFSLGPPGFIGKTIVERLADECRGQGVRILEQAAAKRLLLDDDGRVGGVTAQSGDREIRVAARAVIVATGGFGASAALLETYFPGHTQVFTLNKPEMTGDGLSMVEAAGGWIDDNLVLLVTGPHHYPWSHVLTLLVRRPELILVNSKGERYCDETLFLDYHTEAGNALSRQPGKICYGLLDSSLKNHAMTSGEIVSGMEREAGGAGAWVAELEAELEAGVARDTVAKGDSWQAVADRIGVDAAALSATVARYNEHCERGHDGEFFKEKRFLRPLTIPPYYAVLGRQGFDTTLGGIKVDRRMRVIGRQGSPIPGLYAAGDCASGWEHENYNLRHPGSAMTFALCSGYIAGRDAVASMGPRHAGQDLDVSEETR